MSSGVSSRQPPKPWFGVEPFDVGYGAAYQVESESQIDVECQIVEDGGDLTVRDVPASPVPNRLAFVDGVMTIEARLSRTDPDGTIVTGIAGAWATGGVLADGHAALEIQQVRSARVTIFCGGEPVSLPRQQGGWAWDALAVDELDIDAARRRLLRLMRDGEGEIANTLSDGGWLPVVDGPLNNVRRSRTAPLVGYVKTHRRRMLAPESWVRIPAVGVGQRTSMFAVGDDLYACYSRVGEAGPWASSWAGIVRLEVPSGAGRGEASRILDGATAWLPRYASAPHRDPRAPVNLTPIAGLEAVLRRRSGNAALGLRAVRAAILELNSGSKR